MADSEPQGHGSPVAVAEDVGLRDVQIPQECGRVLRQELEVQRAVDVGRAAVGLQLHTDHLPPLDQARQQLAKRGADRGEGAVKEEERLPLAMDLVVHVEAVHGRVAGPRRGRGGHGVLPPCVL